LEEGWVRCSRLGKRLNELLDDKCNERFGDGADFQAREREKERERERFINLI
jgi:hypothetical protein